MTLPQQGSTALPPRTCPVHGSYSGSSCPGCSTAVQPLPILWPKHPVCDACKPYPGDPCVCGWEHL